LFSIPNLGIKNNTARKVHPETIAQDFSEKQNTLFVDRAALYPIAMKGALKLK